MSVYSNIKNNQNQYVTQEYNNYITKLHIHKVLTNNAKNKIELTKAKTTIESALILKLSMNNNSNNMNPYKQLTLPDYIQNYIQKKILEQKTLKVDDEINYSHDKKFIYLYDIKIKIDKRIEFMIKYAHKNIIKYTNYIKYAWSISVKLVLRCLLRYASIGISGQQCSLSGEIYNYMYDTLNVKGEGFASPLNSKLLEKIDTVICTLNTDTDKYFKSNGPFNFNILNKHNNINWILNPPFLSSSVEQSIKAITDALNIYPNMLIILVIPYTKIKHIRHNIFSKQLYGYINATTINLARSHKIIKRTNKAQYFMCNGIPSDTFTNVYMLFYTNNKTNIDAHIEHISDLWSIQPSTDNIQQSLFKKPFFIKTSNNYELAKYDTS